MSDDKNGSDIDIEKRRDDALRRALSTPPKPKEKGRAFAPLLALDETCVHICPSFEQVVLS